MGCAEFVPETMYPEFRKKLKETDVMPPPCKTGCAGPPNPPPAPWPPAAAPRREVKDQGPGTD
jgi:hypothetical protein